MNPTRSVSDAEFEAAITAFEIARADQARGLPGADVRVNLTRKALQAIEKIITRERDELYRRAAARGVILPRISIPRNLKVQ